MKKLVKTLKINKLLIPQEKLKLRGKTRQNAQNKQTFDLTGKDEMLKHSNSKRETGKYSYFLKTWSINFT